MTSIGVDLMIRSRKSTKVGLTLGSPNAIRLVPRNAISLADRLPRSTTSAIRPLEAPVIIDGMAARTAGRTRAGSQVTGSMVPAAVEISTVPMTLLPNSSGCWSASAMMVMPPIEWPTSTTGVSPGAVASITSCRSAPSWSIVTRLGSERPDLP